MNLIFEEKGHYAPKQIQEVNCLLAEIRIKNRLRYLESVKEAREERAREKEEKRREIRRLLDASELVSR